jgi:hypothetical protein
MDKLFRDSINWRPVPLGEARPARLGAEMTFDAPGLSGSAKATSRHSRGHGGVVKLLKLDETRLAASESLWRHGRSETQRDAVTAQRKWLVICAASDVRPNGSDFNQLPPAPAERAA